MQPQTHPCRDECYSLLKDGTGNEAKWVLWEAIRDWGIHYRLLKHLRHVFIHSHVSFELYLTVTHIMLYAPPFEIWYGLSLLSNFLFCLCLSLSFILLHANANTAWCFYMVLLSCSWVSLSHRWSTYIIHPPSTTLNTDKSLSAFHIDKTDSIRIHDDNLTFHIYFHELRILFN